MLGGFVYLLERDLNLTLHFSGTNVETASQLEQDSVQKKKKKDPMQYNFKSHSFKFLELKSQRKIYQGFSMKKTVCNVVNIFKTFSWNVTFLQDIFLKCRYSRYYFAFNFSKRVIIRVRCNGLEVDLNSRGPQNSQTVLRFVKLLGDQITARQLSL